MRKIIYGPPGTGKTYYLMNELEKFLEKVDPSKIGYFTFSKNAAQEGKSRAMEKFNLTDKDLPFLKIFLTHSLGNMFYLCLVAHILSFSLIVLLVKCFFFISLCFFIKSSHDKYR